MLADERMIVRGKKAARLTPSQWNIFRVLHAIRPHSISTDCLIRRGWPDDPDGGPDSRTLHVHLHFLRERLARVGIRVGSTKGAGARYWLA